MTIQPATIRPVIIDCDPGVDDALALFLAFASPELDILAITTVAGNVSGQRTARNARILAEIAGRTDVRVHLGAERPLMRPPVVADAFHGEEGLGDLDAFEPAAPIADGQSAQAIVEQVMSRPQGAVTLIATGPLTNLALALRREPRLADWLGPVLIMGGARSEGGNITASAEFNIWADPHAAAMVFGSSLQVTVFGLDVTHQVRATEARIRSIETLRTPSADAAARLLRFSQRIERQIVGGDASPLHDPCPVAALIDPRLFQTRPCRIEVETTSPLTLGHTAVEFRVDPASARHHWAVAADADGVFALIANRLGQSQKPAS